MSEKERNAILNKIEWKRYKEFKGNEPLLSEGGSQLEFDKKQILVVVSLENFIQDLVDIIKFLWSGASMYN